MKTTAQTKTPAFLYRYEAWGNYGKDNDERIILRRFAIAKETGCGYWIFLDTGKVEKKWIGKNTYRPFAFTTEQAALESFVTRKINYLRILNTKIKSTINCLEELSRKCADTSVSNGIIEAPIWAT